MKQYSKYFRFIGKYKLIVFTAIVILILILTNFISNDSTLLIGIITSAIVTLTAILIEIFVKSLDSLFLLKLEGKYTCYSHSTNDELKLNNSEATIEFIKDNCLKIVVSDNYGNSWSGDITMLSNEIGKVAWHYNKLGGKTNDAHNRNGLKDLTVIYNNKLRELTVNLISYHDDRFSGEVLKKSI